MKLSSHSPRAEAGSPEQRRLRIRRNKGTVPALRLLERSPQRWTDVTRWPVARMCAGAIPLQLPPDHAVVGGTRRPICFVAVAAQRGIGRHEGKWFAAALTPRGGVIVSSLSAGRRSLRYHL